MLDRAVADFDRAADRWRDLYRAALATSRAQDRIIRDASRPSQDRNQAKRIRAEAEAQLDLLRAEERAAFQSDFYSYRYFAGEGFLPGYSFPRLPLSAFIPARRGPVGRDDYVSRPRFIAITEFGPRAVVYHEGSRYRINRVMLPPERAGDRNELVTHTAKLCGTCGYLHPVEQPPGPDLCECCGADLPHPVRSLFRMQNVSTRRQDRISSDEEERLRVGYEVRTAVRFATEGGRPRITSARVVAGPDPHDDTHGGTDTDGDGDGPGAPLGEFAYGAAATLWRVNLGWRRRRRREQHGFLLDTDSGYWARIDDDPDDARKDGDPEDPDRRPTMRVVPYVEDHRNALVFTPTEALGPLGVTEMASLQAALRRAVQVVFQLEEAELAAEPLPDEQHRRAILLYEAAEGGAGVLRRLVTDAGVLRQVAEKALKVCHIDPATGADLRRAPGAREDCEAACYDCLMSYTNQPDHSWLDRKKVVGHLQRLAGAHLATSPVADDRAAHLERLRRLCQSDLERDWLDWVADHDLALPDDAQVHLEAARTRPDFLYRTQRVAVFIDGPVHDRPRRAADDERITEALEDLGYVVVRFGPDRHTWPGIVDRYRSVFGPGRRPAAEPAAG